MDWNRVDQAPPPANTKLLVGWHDQFGTWVSRVAELRLGHWYEDGRLIATPDWWCVIVPPTPSAKA